MKKIAKKLLPIVLALVFCIGAISLVACGGNEDAVFEGYKENAVGGVPIEVKVTLKADGTAALDFRFDVADKDPDGPYAKMEAAFSSTGTYELKDNVYTVKLGAGDTAMTLTSTYDESTKTYTIPYSFSGQQGTISLDLTYQKA